MLKLAVASGGAIVVAGLHFIELATFINSAGNQFHFFHGYFMTYDFAKDTFNDIARHILLQKN